MLPQACCLTEQEHLALLPQACCLTELAQLLERLLLQNFRMMTGQIRRKLRYRKSLQMTLWKNLAGMKHLLPQNLRMMQEWNLQRILKMSLKSRLSHLLKNSAENSAENW